MGETIQPNAKEGVKIFSKGSPPEFPCPLLRISLHLHPSVSLPGFSQYSIIPLFQFDLVSFAIEGLPARK
jgi:hypothetical protein